LFSFVLFIFFQPVYIPTRQSSDQNYLYYSFARAVTKRTKREQNTVEEQNVNELWRMEQNVNVQMSSKKYILRQYDAAFLCILSRMSQ